MPASLELPLTLGLYVLTSSFDIAGTNVRSGSPLRNQAKNALTRLLHAMRYQLIIAGGTKLEGDFLHKIKTGGRGPEQGQQKLGFMRLPKGVAVA